MDESKLLFRKSHEWALVEGEICTVGISRFAVEQLTDIVYLELPEVGAEVTAGETFGVVESVKAVSDLYAPVSGEVIEVNQPLADDPAGLSDDPYDTGWMIKIRMAADANTAGLLDKSDYDAQIADEAH